MLCQILRFCWTSSFWELFGTMWNCPGSWLSHFMILYWIREARSEFTENHYIAYSWHLGFLQFSYSGIIWDLDEVQWKDIKHAPSMLIKHGFLQSHGFPDFFPWAHSPFVRMNEEKSCLQKSSHVLFLPPHATHASTFWTSCFLTGIRVESLPASDLHECFRKPLDSFGCVFFSHLSLEMTSSVKFITSDQMAEGLTNLFQI